MLIQVVVRRDFHLCIVNQIHSYVLDNNRLYRYVGVNWLDDTETVRLMCIVRIPNFVS